MLTIILRMLAPVTRLLSWTVATTLGCHTRRMSTNAPSPSWRMNYQRNSENWWLFAKKISTIPRNCKNKLTIREWNLGATPLARKSGWTVNILRPNTIGIWRQSSLSHSGCSILSGSKHTSWSFLRSRQFIMFSMYHCQNMTPHRRSGCIRRMRRKWTLATKGNTR